MPRWFGFASVALTVVVAIIAVVGLVSLGRRIGSAEGRASSTSRALGDLEADLSARVDRLADRVSSARTDLAVIKKLSARLTRLSDDLSKHRSADDTKPLAASLGRLEKSLEELKGDVILAMRMASKAAEAKREPSAPAAPAVTPDDLDKIAERITDVEGRLDEIAKAPRTASASPRARVNEQALEKHIEAVVQEQVKAQIERAMRDMFRRRRQGGGGN
jgi:predicted transcriptional regulator